ncbi:peptidylprolyl isomerase [Deinococcus taeanensis]|uniref:peptidylprolyl isomerase n=1 Tax=Deinococcus taeanensis TaxID=2737050 RepID=UPI001CDD671A|nr:peptidylprolyl isomerase [Deinococcus taeanensis]UBV43041.1 peptidylprolyl isomerase [Deinococcus taeanensis]
MRSAALLSGAALLGSILAACAPAPSTTVAAAARVPASPPAQPAGQRFEALAYRSATPVRSFPAAPPRIIDPNRAYRAVLTTSQGTVTLDLYARASPVAVNNFVFLALNRFYDGTRFHRVIDGFMAQGGDPLSAEDSRRAQWGTGGPGYQFPAEVLNGLRFDRAGVLGMARAQSLNSQGSQFFITVAPADFLSGNYTVFGQVVAGQDVLNRLQRNDSGSGPIAGTGADTLLSVQILQGQ